MAGPGGRVPLISSREVDFLAMSDDPYVMLGLSRTSSSAEITEAYRTLAQIYHPDRYTDASDRVRAEANKRMQALNAAYEQVKRAAPPVQPPTTPPTPSPPPPRPPERSAADVTVLYVDGSPRYHSGSVAPLGFSREWEQVQRLADATRCAKLDTELRDWFELQRTNADMSARALYSSWTDEAQAAYAARLGCTTVPWSKARSFGLPCPDCMQQA